MERLNETERREKGGDIECTVVAISVRPCACQQRFFV